MRSNIIEIRIKWESDRKLTVKELEYNNRIFKLSITSEDATVRVFDATRFKESENNLTNAFRNYKEFIHPTMVICRDEDVNKWHFKLPEFQGICPLSSFKEQFPILLVRMCARNHERSKLLKRSYVDSLTGLFNRNEMYRKLDLELEFVNKENPLALLIMDLDHFKMINDIYGHNAGDIVLKGIGRILKKALSDNPNAYRFGGEEFAIIIRMNLTQAKAFGEFIRKEIEEYQFHSSYKNGKKISLTVSIGISVVDQYLDKQNFFQNADNALYQAKGLGRNKVVDYSEYSEEVVNDGNDPEIKDFENRIRVLTERLTSVLTYKSKQMMTQIKKDADHDGLTNLYIRRYFDKRINREFELAKNRNTNLSLIFLDIDHFGMVNKTYGFPTGDQTLKIISTIVKESIRSVDWAARYGGEEICVILPDTSEEVACEIANRIWENIRSTNQSAFDGREFIITASLGVAQLSEKDTDIISFIQRTSDRTRYAKEHGRNQICCKDRGEESVRI